MKDEDLLRYSRQIALPEIDISGQSKIFQSKVIVIGLGGLGTVVASYLCRMGIGEITVIYPSRIANSIPIPSNSPIKLSCIILNSSEGIY